MSKRLVSIVWPAFTSGGCGSGAGLNPPNAASTASPAASSNAITPATIARRARSERPPFLRDCAGGGGCCGGCCRGGGALEWDTPTDITGIRPAMVSRRDAVDVRYVVRAVVNVVNLATPLGVLIGLAGRATFCRGPRGLILATAHRLPYPPNAAFTVGNVIVTRYSREQLIGRPRLLAHEERHAWQYVCCLGLPMIVLYFAACGWSWLRVRDVASRNLFERLAGLVDGGYVAADRECGGPGDDAARPAVRVEDPGVADRGGLDAAVGRAERGAEVAEHDAVVAPDDPAGRAGQR